VRAKRWGRTAAKTPPLRARCFAVASDSLATPSTRAPPHLDRKQQTVMNPKPMVLFNFAQQRDVDRWHVFTDAYFGGSSNAEWRQVPRGDSGGAHEVRRLRSG